MKAVEFEDQDYIPKRRGYKLKDIHKESELVSWVVKKGWIKSKSFAAFTFILISIAFMFFSLLFITEGRVFGFSDKYESRSDQPYYIDVPGIEATIIVNPGENLDEVIRRHKK